MCKKRACVLKSDFNERIKIKGGEQPQPFCLGKGYFSTRIV
ncbi:hypothetical protein DOT_4580 [Desulfosporosinus sp. OT]|nr:hypothetical protein DOT_4580 [Desulfosporosinus sp. OT]